MSNRALLAIISILLCLAIFAQVVRTSKTTPASLSGKEPPSNTPGSVDKRSEVSTLPTSDAGGHPQSTQGAVPAKASTSRPVTKKPDHSETWSSERWKRSGQTIWEPSSLRSQPNIVASHNVAVGETNISVEGLFSVNDGKISAWDANGKPVPALAELLKENIQYQPIRRPFNSKGELIPYTVLPPKEARAGALKELEAFCKQFPSLRLAVLKVVSPPKGMTLEVKLGLKFMSGFASTTVRIQRNIVRRLDENWTDYHIAVADCGMEKPAVLYKVSTELTVDCEAKEGSSFKFDDHFFTLKEIGPIPNGEPGYWTPCKTQFVFEHKPGNSTLPSLEADLLTENLKSLGAFSSNGEIIPSEELHKYYGKDVKHGSEEWKRVPPEIVDHITHISAEVRHGDPENGVFRVYTNMTPLKDSYRLVFSAHKNIVIAFEGIATEPKE